MSVNNQCKPAYSLKSKEVTPSFTGLFNLFSAKNAARATFESDIGIYSQKELARLKERVTKEVVDMFTEPTTPGLAQRLDKILHSPFIDYKTTYFGHGSTNLADEISLYSSNSKGSELYRQFVLTSLAETMPMELIDKSSKADLTRSNKAIYHILDSYSQMDESTPLAAQVRKMVRRLADAEIPIYNDSFLCAKSIRSNQPLMSKTYVEALNLTPESKIEIISENDLLNKIYFNIIHEEIGKPEIIIDPMKNNARFFIVNPVKRNEINKNAKNLNSTFTYDTSKMSLYDLAGLSKNKAVKEETFDMVSWIKANRDRLSFYGKVSYGRDETLRNTLLNAEKYHPELMKPEFLERYIMSYNGKIHYQNIFEEFPSSYITNPKLLEELPKRISSLKKENNAENIERIERLTDFYLFVGDVMSVSKETLQSAIKSMM